MQHPTTFAWDTESSQMQVGERGDGCINHIVGALITFITLFTLGNWIRTNEALR